MTTDVGLETGAIPARRYEKGAAFVARHSLAYLVRSGTVAVWAVHLDGEETITEFVGEDDVCYLPADDVYYFRCEAVSAATVVEIPVTAIYANPGQVKNLLEQQLARGQRLRIWAAYQQRPSVDDRLWGLLHLLAGDFGRQTAAGIVIDLPLTHRVLAAAAGSTRATITRRINSFVRDGRLVLKGGRSGRRYCLPPV